MKSSLLAFLVAAGALTLAACGGGGSSPTPASPTPSPSPTATTTPPTAAASGKVIDYSSQAPLAGITVAIGPWSSGGATPSPVATTAADGTFSFTTAPGDYLLRIGSDSPSDARTTLEQHVTLVAGANPLTVATPPPVADVTPDAVQLSGDFRLHALTADDTACLTDLNAALPAGNGPYAEDEYMWEVNRWLTAEDQQNPTNPYGLDAMRQNNNAGIEAMIDALFNVSITDASFGGGYNTYTGTADASTAAKALAGDVVIRDSDGSTYVPFRMGIDCDATRGYAEGHGLADFR